MSTKSQQEVSAMPASEADLSSFKTPQTAQGEWSQQAPVTPANDAASRQPFPPRASARHSDGSSPVRPSATSEATSAHLRKTSFTGPKPLSLGSQSVVTSGPETPRRGKRMSLSYIPSPSTSTKGESSDAAPSSASLSRAGSLSRGSALPTTSGSSTAATATASSQSRREQSQSTSHASDADDWLMSDEEPDSGSRFNAVPSMAERDSAKIEGQFHDAGYREGITAGKLSTLQGGFDQGFNETRRGTHSKSGSGSTTRNDEGETVLSHNRELLTAIAEKERRCFELREELRQEEAQLKELRVSWQQQATRELAYSSSGGGANGHRRNSSTAGSDRAGSTRPLFQRAESSDSLASGRSQALSSSMPQAAAEAWNSFSAKLPGNLKSQLNNLLDSIANVEQPPELPDKQSPLLAKSTLPSLTSPPSSSASASLSSSSPHDTLRPTGLTIGSTLGVLEEEGSDVGSTAVSPRSPLSPAMPDARFKAQGVDQEQGESRIGLAQEHHTRLASLAKASPSHTSQKKQNRSSAYVDSSVLGFEVDAQGIATPKRTSKGTGLWQDVNTEERGPPTPPKTEAVKTSSNSTAHSSLWQSRRASVLGSLTNLQKQVEQRLQPVEANDAGDAAGGQGEAGFASMFARRFKEAKENASDLLREAERKLGNAMTIDDLVMSNHAQQEGQHSISPRIQLDGGDIGRNGDNISSQPTRSPRMEARQLQAEASPWYEAAGGRRSTETHVRKSPNLAPVRSSYERRSSASSGRSSASQNSDRIYSQLPSTVAGEASPPLSGSVGGGIYGLLMHTIGQDPNSSKVTSDEPHNSKRTSTISSMSGADSDSWNWGAKDEWAWDGDDRKSNNRSSMVSIGLSDTATTPIIDSHHASVTSKR